VAAAIGDDSWVDGRGRRRGRREKSEKSFQGNFLEDFFFACAKHQSEDFVILT